ncbi:hypothetical protein [Polynucleobacter sp. UB-Piko-W3]|jgi:hypothetical protein|uniref:hypothetical protein n=1 Tax=Polynucleobacter sp. UB-Piko-W3 TaxID=1819735 RepID=UPI001C0B75F7|nr:hypothetical protein [Polynucleobacter sp. UB-Piko-W3]MBU3554045.1 hypothetical protein [Polynucleobacter sp. UB-Piko-W3]
MEEYRLQIDKTAKPLMIIDYTFGGDRSLELMKSTNLPTALQNAKVKTEFDLAHAWSDFARKYLESTQEIAGTPLCWGGHYDQLGRVMLEMMRLSRDKQAMVDTEVYEIIPQLEEIPFVSRPATLEDKMFCRIWLSLIRHPAFIEMELDEDELAAFNYWQGLFTIALGKTNSELLKQAA